MDKKAVDKLIKQGAPTAVDSKNTQPRQVVATSGKLRIKVGNPK
jgi:hypothetical protein|tara:strand:- start:761 stop:892 length:132 start_codon:yes stop_codon:yes gene_type:complete